MLAVRLGQRGDLTDKLLWRNSQGLPNVPTPIVYRDTLFVLKERVRPGCDPSDLDLLDLDLLVSEWPSELTGSVGRAGW